MDAKSEERIKQVVKDLCIEGSLNAALIVSTRVFNKTPRELLGDTIEASPPVSIDDHSAAVHLGRKGGLKGGKARAEKLSDERRREIAKRAANTRWRQDDSLRHHNR